MCVLEMQGYGKPGLKASKQESKSWIKQRPSGPAAMAKCAFDLADNDVLVRVHIKYTHSLNWIPTPSDWLEPSKSHACTTASWLQHLFIFCRPLSRRTWSRWPQGRATMARWQKCSPWTRFRQRVTQFDTISSGGDPCFNASRSSLKMTANAAGFYAVHLTANQMGLTNTQQS